MGCVREFGVELHAVEGAALHLHRCKGAGGSGGQRLKEIAGLRHLITVRHPHGGLVGDAGEELALALEAQVGATELAVIGPLHLAPQQMRGQLHAVADAKHGHAQIKERGVARGGARFVDARRTAREDDARRVHRLELRRGDLGRHQQRKHTRIAHAASNQLRRLRSKVENRNDFACRGHWVVGGEGEGEGGGGRSRRHWSEIERRLADGAGVPKFLSAGMRLSGTGHSKLISSGFQPASHSSKPLNFTCAFLHFGTSHPTYFFGFSCPKRFSVWPCFSRA